MNKNIIAYCLMYVTGIATGAGVVLLTSDRKALMPFASSVTTVSKSNRGVVALSDFVGNTTSEKTVQNKAEISEKQFLLAQDKADDWSKTFNSFSRLQDKEKFINGLIEAKMRTQPQEVLAFLRGLPVSRIRNIALEHSLSIYAETSPENAVKEAQQLLHGSESYNALASIAYVWGAHNPQTALDWVVKQPNKQLAQMMLDNVVSSAAQTDPLKIRDLIENDSLLSGEQRGLAARALAGVWTQNQPQEAINWAKGYTAQSGDTQILSIAYLNWATLDPGNAVKSLGMEDKRFSMPLTAEIAGIWASQDPKSAAEWVITTVNNEQRSNAIVNIAQTWTDTDPEAALQWITSLPYTDIARTAALQGLALRWSLHNPSGFKQKLAELPVQLQTEIQNSLATLSATDLKK